MLLTTSPFICSKTASCWDVLENHCPPLHSLSLLFCWGHGNAKHYLFSLDTKGSSTSSETHRSQKHRWVQNMEKYHQDISGIFLLNYSAAASEAHINNPFPTTFSFLVASKSNIVAKFIRLQHERKKSVLRRQSYTPWLKKKKKSFTFPARKEMMGNWDYDANVNKAARQWVHA